jgi:predicted MFS family arabinose efflux permease
MDRDRVVDENKPALPATPEPMRDHDLDAAATRRMILILAVCGFASSFAIRSLDPLIGVIARDLQSDPHTIALLATAFAIPYAFIQPVLGPVGDALGKERIMKICLAVLVATLIASAMTPNAPTLFGLRMMSGAAAGGVIPMVLATIGDRVEMARRQIAISRFLLAVIIGQLSGATLSGFLAGFVGWRGVFWLSSGLALIGFLAALVGFARSAAPARAFDLSLALANYRKIVGIPRARALFSFVFVEGIVIFGIFPYIAPLLEARGAGGPSEAGLVVAAFAAGGILYSALVAWLLRTLGLAWMLVAAGAFGVLGFAGVAAANHWGLDALAMVALGLSFYMLHNSFQTQVTEVAPQARGSAVALHAFSFFCGQALGPVSLGFGLATLGVAPTMLFGAAAILALGFVAARILAPAQLRIR